MRFELSDGSSHKFWEITQKGKVLHVVWGRLGTAGQTQDKSFASPDAAKREHDKLVASKRKKGYVEVGAKSSKKPTAKPAAKAPATKASARAARTVAPNGRIAKIVGQLRASNAPLWMIVADAGVAASWRGSVDKNKTTDDLQRALARKDRMIAIGPEQGVCVEIGHRSGWSHIFHASDGNYPCFRLVDASLSDDNKATRDREIALRIAQWPITTMPKRIGKIPCPSGVLALMVPHRDGAFTAKERAKAAGGEVVVDRIGDRVLLPMPDGPGMYEVARYPFRPQKGRGDYADELGEYGSVIEIGYIDRLPKRYAT